MKFDYQLRVEGVLNKIVPRETSSKGFKLISSRCVHTGYEYAYRVPTGYAIADVERQLDALRAACGCGVELEDRAGVIIIKVYRDDFPDEIPFLDSYLSLTQDREVTLGFTRLQTPFTHHFRIPHGMIAGMSGYGKTDLVRWILYQLITRFTPDQLEIHIIDMKGFSFLPFKDIPHVHIVRDLTGARVTLKEARDLMKDRSDEIWETNNRELTATYKWHLVVIDEAAQIAPKLMKGDTQKIANDCDQYAAEISAIGREASVGLIYCTQRPDSHVINPLVKANMDLKICFRTATDTNSWIVLDREGAERLPHGKPGRCLVATDDLQEIQVPYIGKDDAWEVLLKPYRSVKHDQTRTTQDTNPQNDERPSNRLDGSSLATLSREWESLQKGIGDNESIGESKTSRGETEGNRKDQNLETHIRWTFPPPNKKKTYPPNELSKGGSHPGDR